MSNVLIVDDAAFMRFTLKNILENNGFQVIGEAEDGRTAISKYKELSPNLVTMDITMPEMNGLEALQEILKIDSKAKVVIVSALGQESIVKQAIAAGAKSYVLKPFKEEQVVTVLTQVASK
ncbi:MAG: response regulator [Peptococcaceae bacterium]|nr:response regulator [Peptococcaceae bacterium]